MALMSMYLPHVDGATEPYITDAVCALVAANDSKSVLETGAFMGHTAFRLAQTLSNMGGKRELIVAEIDTERANAIDRTLQANQTSGARLISDDLTWRILAQDVMQVIASLPDESLDAVWIDDDHTAQHVADEIQALFPKMRQNGLLLFHDVFGVCNLHEVVRQYGGYSLDFPRWGPAGGLGVIQCR